jgi:hypothetical protein
MALSSQNGSYCPLRAVCCDIRGDRNSALSLGRLLREIKWLSCVFAVESAAVARGSYVFRTIELLGFSSMIRAAFAGRRGMAAKNQEI